MNPTTDPRLSRRSPAHRSKITASILSGGAVLAIVTAMAANAPDRFADSGADPGQVGGAASSTASTGGVSDRADTAAVPAPAPGRSAVTVPHGISRGSGG
ncbi:MULTISPECIES: hypothetical protein [unclassified Rhodococcus (in: high G+C Gram-positive bacteria)]|uniref:hypothetical protein n=1 Tax=unclassified Rhodococcus (in: high G+C Gram-positive bacteria) TaxID=192944 RepID=UPI00092A1002|nr:hypothetical protein [Rhodococcus sp. M8]OLL16455.1 hypothetical protein BKE56_024030 [Rhodococcus sp. M8]QPG46525.1 hypothetical protein ISO16_05655 [Rhodococcus sp. M8]